MPALTPLLAAPCDYSPEEAILTRTLASSSVSYIRLPLNIQLNDLTADIARRGVEVGKQQILCLANVCTCFASVYHSPIPVTPLVNALQ